MCEIRPITCITIIFLFFNVAFVLYVLFPLIIGATAYLAHFIIWTYCLVGAIFAFTLSMQNLYLRNFANIEELKDFKYTFVFDYLLAVGLLISGCIIQTKPELQSIKNSTTPELWTCFFVTFWYTVSLFISVASMPILYFFV